MSKKGLPDMTVYPYLGSNMSDGKPYTPNICSASSSTLNKSPTKLTVKGYNDISDSDVKGLLIKSPIVISVDATNWSQYTGGVFKCSGTPSLNHAVLVVGYDSNGNYIIKNSWGADWGNKGYITLSSKNDCGLKQYIYTYDF
jgi:hypothetical protein